MSNAAAVLEVHEPEAPSVALVHGLEDLANVEQLPGDLAAVEIAKVEAMFAPLCQSIGSHRAKARLILDTRDAKSAPKEARTLRLALRSERVEIKKTREAMKRPILIAGRMVDRAAGLAESMYEAIEADLEEVEKAAERAEARRVEALRSARAGQLEALGVPVPLHPSGLGALSEDLFAACVADAKEAKETREEAARVEDEVRKETEARLARDRETKRADVAKAAEAKRIADLGAQRYAVIEAIGVPAQLSPEDLGPMPEDEWQREKAGAEAVRDALAKAREERDAKQSAEIARLAKETADAKAVADRLQDEADERRNRAEREELRRDEAAAAERERIAARSDREVMIVTAGLIRDAKLPEVQSEKGRVIVGKIRARLVKLAEDIEKAAGELC
jgi:uncharacterized protein YciI